MMVLREFETAARTPSKSALGKGQRAIGREKQHQMSVPAGGACFGAGWPPGDCDAKTTASQIMLKDKIEP